jgi:5-methyltetrahydrofolate--homocysteine methyltransferase
LNKALEGLKPLLVQSGIKPVGKAVICTVQGDRHDIGKNLVKMMMTGAGIEVIDLGVNIGAPQIVEAVKKHNPGIVALSALLTTTMINQKAIIDALAGAGLRGKVKVMVGGAPVTEEFAKEIGADAYTPDAATAAETAKSFFNSGI